MKKTVEKNSVISENSMPNSVLITEKKKRGHLATLKPWVKGQSGNPKGKPRGTFSMTAELRRMLDQPVLDKDGKPVKLYGRNMLYREAAILGLLNAGVKGNVLANTEIFNRIDGKQGSGVFAGEDADIDEIKITFNKKK